MDPIPVSALQPLINHKEAEAVAGKATELVALGIDAGPHSVQKVGLQVLSQSVACRLDFEARTLVGITAIEFATVEPDASQVGPELRGRPPKLDKLYLLPVRLPLLLPAGAVVESVTCRNLASNSEGAGAASFCEAELGASAGAWHTLHLPKQGGRCASGGDGFTPQPPVVLHCPASILSPLEAKRRAALRVKWRVGPAALSPATSSSAYFLRMPAHVRDSGGVLPCLDAEDDGPGTLESDLFFVACGGGETGALAVPWMPVLNTSLERRRCPVRVEVLLPRGLGAVSVGRLASSRVSEDGLVLFRFEETLVVDPGRLPLFAGAFSLGCPAPVPSAASVTEASVEQAGMSVDAAAAENASGSAVNATGVRKPAGASRSNRPSAVSSRSSRSGGSMAMGASGAPLGVDAAAAAAAHAASVNAAAAERRELLGRVAVRALAPRGFAQHLEGAADAAVGAIAAMEKELGRLFPMAACNVLFLPLHSFHPFPLEAAAAHVDPLPRSYSFGALQVLDLSLLGVTCSNTEAEVVNPLLALSAASAWFGAAVQVGSSADEWLIHGISAFLADRCLLQRGPSGQPELIALLRRLGNQYTTCVEMGLDDRPLNQTAIAICEHGGKRLAPLGPVRRVKARLVMHSLCRLIGWTRFRDRLATVVDAFTSGDALSTSQFMEVLQQGGAISEVVLDSFAHQWIYGVGCPLVHVGWFYQRSAHRLEICVSQAPLEPLACAPTLEPVVPDPEDMRSNKHGLGFGYAGHMSASGGPGSGSAAAAAALAAAAAGGAPSSGVGAGVGPAGDGAAAGAGAAGAGSAASFAAAATAVPGALAAVAGRLELALAAVGRRVGNSPEEEAPETSWKYWTGPILVNVHSDDGALIGRARLELQGATPAWASIQLPGSMKSLRQLSTTVSGSSTVVAPELPRGLGFLTVNAGTLRWPLARVYICQPTEYWQSALQHSRDVAVEGDAADVLRRLPLLSSSVSCLAESLNPDRHPDVATTAASSLCQIAEKSRVDVRAEAIGSLQRMTTSYQHWRQSRDIERTRLLLGRATVSMKVVLASIVAECQHASRLDPLVYSVCDAISVAPELTAAVSKFLDSQVQLEPMLPSEGQRVAVAALLALSAHRDALNLDHFLATEEETAGLDDSEDDVEMGAKKACQEQKQQPQPQQHAQQQRQQQPARRPVHCVWGRAVRRTACLTAVRRRELKRVWQEVSGVCGELAEGAGKQEQGGALNMDVQGHVLQHAVWACDALLREPPSVAAEDAPGGAGAGQAVAALPTIAEEKADDAASSGGASGVGKSAEAPGAAATPVDKWAKLREDLLATLAEADAGRLCRWPTLLATLEPILREVKRNMAREAARQAALQTATELANQQNGNVATGLAAMLAEEAHLPASRGLHGPLPPELESLAGVAASAVEEAARHERNPRKRRKLVVCRSGN